VAGIAYKAGPRSGAIPGPRDWFDNTDCWFDNQPEYPTAQAEQEADDARDPRYDLDPAEQMEMDAEEVE